MDSAKAVDKVFVTRAAEIVMAHLDQHDFAGIELASHLNLSREQTHRKLKKDTTLSSGKFISYLRLLQAYHYLQTARYTIAEVAYKVGFESPAYFNKCFKEAFGIRPGDLKKKGNVLQSGGAPIFNFYQLPEISAVLNSSGVSLSFQKAEKSLSKRPVKQWSAVGFFVVIAIVTMTYYYKSSKKFSGFLPGEKGRIAIVPFNNQTGDSLMKPVGDIASSWISGQLDDLNEVKIVPYFTIREYLPYLGILPDDPNGRPTLGEVVHADYIITGSYFVRSGNLYVDSRLVDAHSQELIYSIPVITGPKDSVMQILETLRLKIAGLLTNLEDVKMGKLNPPGYKAYVHYLQGLEELKSGQYPEQARLHFESAAALEPGFVMPQLFLTWFYRGRELDSLVHLLGQIKNTTRYEKNVCAEAYQLFLNRNYMESLRISLKMLENYPQDYYFNLLAAHRAKAQFMPNLSLKVLSKLNDPLQKDVGLVWYYYKIWNVTESLMMLGKYEEAIEYLNSIPLDYHNHAMPTIYIAAYVQAGKTQTEIEELITRFCRNDVKSCAEYYTNAAYEFSLISATETANYFAAKAKTLMSSFPEKRAFDFDLIDVLYLAGDYKGAKALVKQELQKNPGDLELKTYLAYIEASLGNTVVAEEIFSGIKEDTLIRWRRHEFDYQFDYLKARMFALSGKKEAALNLLQRALAKGQFCHHWDFGRDIFLKNIFNEPSFQAMIKPKEYSGITGLP
jgi:AraC-like DNA-binding protein/TolB-like protein